MNSVVRMLVPRVCVSWALGLVAFSATQDRALAQGGTVVAGGYNIYGQCNVPADMTNVVNIGAGSYSTFGVRPNGTFSAWGDNLYGRLNYPPGVSNVVVALGTADNSAVLRSDGTVVPNGTQLVPLLGMSNIVALSGSRAGLMGLRSDSTAWSPGPPAYPIPQFTNVVAVSIARSMYSGAPRSLGLRPDGTVVGLSSIPAGLSNIVGVAAGMEHSLVLKSDGTVIAWGDDTWGRATVPAGLSNVVEIAIGWPHSLALRSDGTVVGWGGNYDGTISFASTLTDVMAIASGENHMVALCGRSAPYINVPPASFWCYSGQYANFTVQVIGTQPLRYQWLRDGTEIAGATNWFYGISAPQTNDSGSYSVRITNDLGSTNSPAGTVTVIACPPLFVVQPTNMSAVIRSTVTFQAATDGPWPVYFQWQKDGIDISGATNLSLTLDVQTTNQAGSYTMIASNNFGFTTSSNAVLSVIGLPPSITGSPANQAILNAAPFSFQGSASGSPPLYYQWLFNNSPIPGATNSTLNLTGYLYQNEGVYSLLVSNLFGTDITSEARLTILPISAWGDNRSGQLNVPLTLTNPVAVAVGSDHALALRDDGTVVAWGSGTYGETVVPPDLTNAIAVGAGSRYSVALRSDGTLSVWGAGQTNAATFPNYGQCFVPPEATNIASFAAGGGHILAVTSNGRVIAWGRNDYGQTNVPAGLSNVIAVAAGPLHSLALRSDGKVFAWGSDVVPVAPGTTWYGGQIDVPASLPPVVALAGGTAHSLGLKADGTVAAWGWNYYGQCNVPAGLANVVAIDCGGEHSVALRSDGTVAAWGRSEVNATAVPPGLSNVVGISSMSFANLVVLSRGKPMIRTPLLQQTVYSGRSTNLRALVLGPGPMTYQWFFNGAAIDGATNLVLSLDNLGTNASGTYSFVVSNQFGTATSTAGGLSVIEQAPTFLSQPAVLVKPWHDSASFSVTTDGSVPMSYQWRFQGLDIPGATNSSLSLSDISPGQMGAYSVLACNAFGTNLSTSARLTVLQVVGTGGNNYGQINIPTSLTNVIAIAAGGNHSMALNADHTLTLWGSMTNAPATATNIIGMAGGNLHSIALRADGTVLAWGDNYSGQTNVPPGLNDAVAVAAGSFHSMALRRSGTVLAWGNYGAPTNVPAGLSNVTAIAAGSSHSMALKADGSVVAWGQNSYGLTNVPASATNVVAIAARQNRSVALRADGTIISWGDLTTPYWASSNHIAVAAGNSIVALNSNLKAVGIGLPINTNLAALVAGDTHYLALLGTGAPFITAQPASQTISTGDRLSLRVMAGSQAPLNYCWYFNGTPITDATNSALMFPTVRRTQGGDYTVVASNSLGAATSTVASVAVLVRPPFFVTNPAPVTVVTASVVSLQASATGAQPLAYRWRKGLSPIIDNPHYQGTTNSTLTIFNPLPSDSGWYSLVVSNEDGKATSLPGLVLSGPRSFACWGQNSSGQAAPPASAADLIAVAGGSGHCVALKPDGTVVAWGQNNYGQATVPAGLMGVQAIAARGEHSLALKTNGSVTLWGRSYSGNSPTLTNMVAIDTGLDHAVALRSDGKLVLWGSNTYGQTNVPAGLSDVVAVAAGYYHTLALKRDGTVVAWGQSGGQTNVPPGLSNVVAIAAGNTHSLALRADGTLAAWGAAGAPQSSVPYGLSNVVAIATGANHNLAAQTNGSVVAWGWNTAGQITMPAGLSNVLNVAAGADFSLAIVGDSVPCIFLQPFSRMVSAGQNAVFTVGVSGSAPLGYQWQLGENNVNSGISSRLELTNVAVTAAGQYRCVVTNNLGSVTSIVATLTVNRFPVAFDSSAQGLGPDGFRLRLTGLAGQGSTTIFGSTNLVDWSALFTNPPCVGVLDWVDPKATNSPYKFYKAVEGTNN